MPMLPAPTTAMSVLPVDVIIRALALGCPDHPRYPSGTDWIPSATVVASGRSRSAGKGTMIADVVFIGCGDMGGALAGGYQRQVPGSRLLVVDPDVTKARRALPDERLVAIVATIAEIRECRPSMTVLAVKPQALPAVL